MIEVKEIKEGLSPQKQENIMATILRNIKKDYFKEMEKKDEKQD